MISDCPQKMRCYMEFYITMKGSIPNKVRESTGQPTRIAPTFAVLNLVYATAVAVSTDFTFRNRRAENLLQGTCHRLRAESPSDCFCNLLRVSFFSYSAGVKLTLAGACSLAVEANFPAVAVFIASPEVNELASGVVCQIMMRCTSHPPNFATLALVFAVSKIPETQACSHR
uniref:Ash family protein n=1 Tax=Ascaris lumbricoides TaxID=6252 RepID=A0A0M3I2D1_ASCLU